MPTADEDFIDQIVNRCLNEDAPTPAPGRATPTGNAQRAGSHRSGLPTPPEASLIPNRSFDQMNTSLLNRSDVSGRASFASPSPNHPRHSTNTLSASQRVPEEHQLRHLSQGQAQEFHSSPNPHHRSGVEVSPTDATVRRIQLWEERKKTRQLIQQHEKMERELEECTFKPNTTMARTSIHLKKNIPASKAPGSATRGLTAQNLRIAGVRGGGGEYTTDDQEVFAAQAKAQELLAPSVLYANNEAWGFDNFVSRQIYARERKEEEAAWAASIFALKNPNVVRREPTVPEPFELGRTVHKGTIRSVHTKPAEIVAKKVRSANANSFYAERGADGRIGVGGGQSSPMGGGANLSGLRMDKFGSSYNGYTNSDALDLEDSYRQDDSAYYDPMYSRNFRGVDGENGEDLGAKDVVAPSVPSGLFSIQASSVFASKVRGSPSSAARSGVAASAARRDYH